MLGWGAASFLPILPYGTQLFSIWQKHWYWQKLAKIKISAGGAGTFLMEHMLTFRKF